MSKYRVEMAFYVDAESETEARFQVEEGISSDLSKDYEWVDTELEY